MATDLLRRFTEVARSNPGVPAVMGPDLCLSFSDLDLLSDRAAAIFTRAGDAGILQGEMPYSIDTLPVIGFYHCRSARHGGRQSSHSLYAPGLRLAGQPSESGQGQLSHVPACVRQGGYVRVRLGR